MKTAVLTRMTGEEEITGFIVAGKDTALRGSIHDQAGPATIDPSRHPR